MSFEDEGDDILKEIRSQRDLKKFICKFAGKN